MQTIVFDLEPVRNNILSIESVLEMLKAKSLYYYDIDKDRNIPIKSQSRLRDFHSSPNISKYHPYPQPTYIGLLHRHSSPSIIAQTKERNMP